MGAAASLLIINDPNIVFIDDIRPKDPTMKGFSRQIFKRFEWPTLKLFCNTYAIQHADVCTVFKRFLQYEEVYLLQFRVRMKDVRNHFSRHSRLEQVCLVEQICNPNQFSIYLQNYYSLFLKEIADACIPLMFMKEFAGLDQATAPCEDVSLPRFIIMVYIFCAEQIPDAILGFVTFLRQKLHMSANAKLHTYSLDQLLRVLMEDLQPSAAAAILLESVGRLGKEDELSMLAVVKLGIKYPILFYVLERFRKHIRRIAFGDKFWENRSQLKLKIEDLEGSSDFFNAVYKNEQTAIIETSRSIIADVMSSKRLKRYRVNARFPPTVVCIDEHCLERLKDLFGYEKSRQLAIDSDIVLDCQSLFVERAFGATAPLPRPGWGFQVFPDGIPHPILSLPIDADFEDDDSCDSDREDAAIPEDNGGSDGAVDGKSVSRADDDEQHDEQIGGGQAAPSEEPRGWIEEVQGTGKSRSVRWKVDGDNGDNDEPVVVTVVLGDEGEGEDQEAKGVIAGEQRDGQYVYRRSVSAASRASWASDYSQYEDEANHEDLFEGGSSPVCTELRSAPSFPSTGRSPSSRGVPSALGTHDEAEAMRQSLSLLSETQRERSVETIADPQVGREFRFDPATGKSAWVLSIVDQDGDLLHEYCA